MTLEGLPPELRQALANTDPLDDDVYDLGGIPRPVRWNALSHEEARSQWDRLIPWVSWLTTRYALPQSLVPGCWPWHGALVEELTALQGAYEVAYNDNQAATAMLEWHAMFAMCRARLTEWASVTRCARDDHRAAPQQGWPDDPMWALALRNRLDDLYGTNDGPR